MNQIDYTLVVRRWSAITLGISSVSLGYIIFFLDPFVNSSYVWAFLIALAVFFGSFICVSAIWFFFHNQKKILSVTQTNNLLYQSVVSSGSIILLFALQVTGYFNIFSFFLVLLCYGLYQVYANSNSQ